MANLYSWAVNNLTVYPQHENQTNVVYNAQWVCSGTDGTYNAASYGSTDVEYKPEEPFVPYENLTIEQVIGWVHDKIGTDGVSKAEQECDAQIEAQKTVTSITPPLPWNVPTPAPVVEPTPEINP